jgi:hypothetical protein
MGLNIKAPKNAGKNTSHKHQIRGGKSLPHPPKGTGRAYKGVNMIPSIKKTISFLIIRGGVPLHKK